MKLPEGQAWSSEGEGDTCPTRHGGVTDVAPDHLLTSILILSSHLKRAFVFSLKHTGEEDLKDGHAHSLFY